MVTFIQRAEYSELYDKIENELAQRASDGMPLRVNFWDAAHIGSDSIEIFADPRLNNLLSAYGKPAYVAEAVGSKQMNNGVKLYSQAPAEQREQISQQLLAPIAQQYGGSAEGQERYYAASVQLFEHAANGAEVFYPDPRGELFEQALQMPGAVYLNEYKQHIQQHQNEAPEEILQGFRSKLDSRSLEHFDAFELAFTNAADGRPIDTPRLGGPDMGTTMVDAVMIERITAKMPNSGERGGTIVASMYGLRHFAKGNDLNEALDGLDIAIGKDPETISMVRGENPALYNDIPDYVYYTNDQRLVKLDTPAAQSEYLGESAEKAAFREAVMTISSALPPDVLEDVGKLGASAGGGASPQEVADGGIPGEQASQAVGGGTMPAQGASRPF